MNDLETKELIKIISSANEETQIYLAKTAPIKVICEMAFAKIKPRVVEIILERLKEEKNTREVKNIALSLVNSEHSSFREFAAKIVPLNLVCEIALYEKNYNVLNVILSRLEAEQDSNEVKNIALNLVNSVCWEFREFAAKIVPLNLVGKMVLTEKNYGVVTAILLRLKAEQDSDEVKNIALNLVNSDCWEFREFAAKIVPLNLVCEITLYEKDTYVANIIISRLEAEKETDEVKNIALKLINSDNSIFREFAAKIAPLKVVCEMALNERNDDIVNVIISRLKDEQYSDEVKNIALKLINSNNWRFREFAAKIVPLNLVGKMALN